MKLQSFKKYKDNTNKTFYRLAKDTGITAAQLNKLYVGGALIDLDTGEFYIKSKSKLKMIEVQ